MTDQKVTEVFGTKEAMNKVVAALEIKTHEGSEALSKTSAMIRKLSN